MKNSVLIALSSLACACGGAADGDEGFTPAEPVVAPEQTLQQPRSIARVEIAKLAPRAAIDPKLLRTAHDKLEAAADRGIAETATGGPAIPKALSKRTAAQDRALFAFPGLGIDDVDRALGGQTGITPPDQGLCVGNGFVLELVNSAGRIFDITGGPVGDPIDLRALFSFPADAGTAFSFASDPKCYFDQATGRFFATVLRIPFDTTTGQITGSALDLVVSESGDPRGAWNAFEIDLTDTGANGAPNHAHCPCLGDQPLIGADTNGFYVTTNEFGLDPASPGFNGAQIYAFDKASLVAGRLPAVVHLANLVLANGIAVSVQPATSPTGTGADDAYGTEYFLSSLDFDGAGDNRIALWGLSNTRSLADAAPAVVLEHAVLRSEEYAFPPAAVQQPGPTPLRDCLATGTCPGLEGTTLTSDIAELETDDDRMNQAVYAGGLVWGALDTAVQASRVRAGIAFFAVEPRLLASGHLGGKVHRQGYLALDDADLLYPSVAVTDDGRGAIAFSLTGEHDFPSAAYARIVDAKVSQVVRVSAAGIAPLDDASGYQGGPSRFGDYSAALIDGSTVWMANEAITSPCTTLDCRDEFTNWGTSISRVDLSDALDK